MKKISEILVPVVAIVLGSMLALWLLFRSIPFLVLLLVPLLVIIPTRVSLGAKYWPSNGWDGIISQVGGALVFFFGFSLSILTVLGMFIKIFDQYKDSVVMFGLSAIAINFVICNYLVAKRSVDEEQKKKVSDLDSDKSWMSRSQKTPQS
jgi:hypothetical protein